MADSPVSTAQVGSDHPVTPTSAVVPDAIGTGRARKSQDDGDNEDEFELLHGLHENQTSTDYLEELNSVCSSRCVL